MSTPTTSHETLVIAYLTGQASAEDISTYKNLFDNDETFRQIVRDVEMWLAPLNESTAEISPPEGLLESILEGLDPAPQAETTNINQTEEQTSVAPFRSDVEAVNDNSSGKWKALAIAASLLAVAAIGSHFVNLNSNDVSQTPPDLQVQKPLSQEQQFLALLSDESKPELVAIIYNPTSGRVVARLSNITVPEEGDLQLWLIREGEAAPQSLGVMERAGDNEQIEFDIPVSLQIGTDVLAISLEKKGGSASAGPEGPVLFTGAVAPIKHDI